MSAESELLDKIRDISRPVRIMHICGTHERTISKYSMRDVLPEEIEVLSGPGCPVCVTPEQEIDRAIALAESGVILTSFGDMMRVPGSNGSLMEARSRGADVRMVYSIDDAIAIAEKEPESKVVFFAIGFETTAPTNAAAVLRKPPGNFSLLLSHKLTIPAMNELIDEIEVDAFIAPGHVCTIIGIHPFDQFAEKGFPVIAAGFEADELLLSILMVLEQQRSGNHTVENAYPRAVKNEGNRRAQEMMEKVFEVIDSDWRGIGTIKDSGMKLRPEFAMYDAAVIYEDLINEKVKDISYENSASSLCRCAEILKGKEKPSDCPLFTKKCNPANPVGSCMVSQEGMCYNWYRYRGVEDA
ncbi:hydrogenase formation protein HypD [Methanolobus profundi]|uniref:Hydrogenase expression/formation protein HypD n=1 Tax=Methanolobus profundi TaxID=487685 RepID=A0A1I4PSX5_9EURY|nr:hydrogenase formation protein HypD [Methanolobus profundi]SFM30600.1 hydrogenase expression/formation protein HypD [Methanolobus profundi]